MVHEWALAEAVINYIKDVKKIKHVKVLKLGLGILQSVDEEILKFSIKELSKIKGLVIDEVITEEEPAVLKCRSCGFEWTYEPSKFPEDIREAIHFVPEVAHAYIKCPKCGSRDFNIVSGRGVRIIEVVGNE